MYALIDISNQMLEDSAFDMEGEIRGEATEQFAVKEGAEIRGTVRAGQKSCSVQALYCRRPQSRPNKSRASSPAPANRWKVGKEHAARLFQGGPDLNTNPTGVKGHRTAKNALLRPSDYRGAIVRHVPMAVGWPVERSV
jgi:hypothetical protein